MNTFVTAMKTLMAKQNIKLEEQGKSIKVNFPWTSMTYQTSNDVYGFRNVHDMMRMSNQVEDLPSLADLGWTAELEAAKVEAEVTAIVEAPTNQSFYRRAGKMVLAVAGVAIIGTVGYLAYSSFQGETA